MTRQIKALQVELTQLAPAKPKKTTAKKPGKFDSPALVRAAKEAHEPLTALEVATATGYELSGALHRSRITTGWMPR
jgi:hypothetical protein